MDSVNQMKLTWKLLIALLFIAVLLPFTILKNENGNTLMSFSDFSLSSVSMPAFSMPNFSANFGSGEIVPANDDDMSGKVIFYKWYDSEGNIQFSSEPPPDGIEYTLKGFDPNANVIPSVKLPPDQTQTKESATTPVKAAGSENGDDPYSVDRITKLFEDTKNIEELLSQRLNNQESELNQ